ncbi:MAG: hypothetical protein F6K31_37375 [Symploca sp. SIO2G7]|nr:hypothetical protein [Symploca sp. SIO2G7]
MLHSDESDALALLTNIKLGIQAESAPADVCDADIYAKVQQLGNTAQDYLITFTARPLTATTWLNQQISSIPSVR